MAIKEEIYYDGGPHLADLIISLIVGVFIVTLPITIGAIVRALWVRYLITDRRVSVKGGWLGQNRTDVVYAEITKVIVVPRGLGWGDIVLTLNDGSRLEMRAVPNFRKIYSLIEGKLPFTARTESIGFGKANSA